MSGKTLNRIRKKGVELSFKRYLGEDIVADEHLIPNDPIECELSNYMGNFVIAGSPQKKEVFIAEHLLKELEEIAEKEHVDLSTLISVYLLQQLERNKETRIRGKGRTKGKITYLLNNLHEGSNFIQYAEEKKEFESNVFDNREMEETLTFETTIYDEYIYIEKYLMAHGYTREQIEQIQKEEWEEYGTVTNLGVKMVKPYSINLEIQWYLGDKLIFDLPDLRPVYISTRLGFHYLLMKKSDGTRTYREIEELMNEQLKGDEKVWGLYKRYLEKKIIEQYK